MSAQTAARKISSPRIKLLRHQDAELFDRRHFLVFHCGGRGSGKSKINFLHYFIRAGMAVDLAYGLFAATDAQLQTFIALIIEQLDALGLKYVIETKAPKKWRRRWRRRNITVPPRRHRNLKMLIVENGLHIFFGSLVNNSYARVKSLDLMFALIEEATDPGVTLDAITTIIGNVRCGLGEELCKLRRHDHQVVVKFNVPLNDPGHWVYREHDAQEAKEAERARKKEPPFYRLIESSTRDNPHTGSYDERLRAAWDLDTYEEQTSGKLRRRTHSLSYHKFDEQKNILGSLRYDRDRDLHIWFDFNHAPGTAGWGHDLRYDEVPEPELRSGYNYFGIVGELHSGHDTFLTDQVANALLEDPLSRGSFKEKRCKDCPHHMGEHMEMHDSWLCKQCGHQTRKGVYCTGAVASIDERSSPLARGYIHCAPGIKPGEMWRGLAKHRGLIYVYGDASGKQTHADSSVEGGSRRILRDLFAANLGERVFFRFREANPAVRLRVLAVNTGLCAGSGVHSIYVHPECVAHLADFREVIPGKDGDPKKEPRPKKPTQDTYWQRTHSSDGFGYMWDYRFPARYGASASVPAMVPASELPPFASLGRP